MIFNVDQIVSFLQSDKFHRPTSILKIQHPTIKNEDLIGSAQINWEYLVSTDIVEVGLLITPNFISGSVCVGDKDEPGDIGAFSSRSFDSLETWEKFVSGDLIGWIGKE